MERNGKKCDGGANVWVETALMYKMSEMCLIKILYL